MHSEDLLKTQQKLNNVSPSFCLAKWKHLSLHLHLGHNHSCHHPNTHKINKHEIKKTPGALHNTSLKKLSRKQMLDGERPSECNYCWSVEDSGGVSDRIYKSASHWAEPYIEDVLSQGANGKVQPSYLEVSFSHACNFKCSYCDPRLSSSWENEIKAHGPYILSRLHNGIGFLSFDQKRPFPVNKENPYVKSFWQWWPEIYNGLKVLRVTGGEPLLSKDTFLLLDKVLNTPHPNLQLAINTNLGVSDKILDKFISKLKQFKKNHHVEKLQIFTSVDGWGEQAAYIRNGMDFTIFWNNLNKVLLELPDVDIHIMSTFNSLSVPSYDKFLNEAIKLNQEVKAQRSVTSEFKIDINHLVNPHFQSVLALPKEVSLACINKSIQVASSCKDESFKINIIDKLERIQKYIKNTDLENINSALADFFKFFNEHDKRRDSQFLKVFPELKNFYKLCETEALQAGTRPTYNIYHKLAHQYLKLRQ